MSQFDEVIPRLGTNSAKWDGVKNVFGSEGIIPMWVADMDFKAPKPVLDALKKQSDHGIFGYTNDSKKAKEAIIHWNQMRHQFTIPEEAILLNTAVVPSISLAIRALTNESDSILMHSPIYPPFFKVAQETKRNIVKSPLRYQDQRLFIDIEDMERKIKTENVKLFLLCNPQNPGSRVWDKEELQQIVDLCKKYQLPIVSDEVHADLVMKGKKHRPLAALAPEYQDQMITLMAPSKTFNLAALKVSYLIITNPEYRKLFEAKQTYIHAAEINIFGLVGMEAAYNEGVHWLDELRDYLYENYQYVKAELKTYAPAVSVTKFEATYLLWLDVRKIDKDERTLYQDIIHAGCGVQMGSNFGKEGTGFIRVNIACPRETLKAGIAALIDGINH
ncbi:MalY/PatB family protein [Listeria sp. PSOL-1]|uniref:MalY/PatB family protein n=1 Tax=Listeria sp. PSOL-1 TaxID=1844999 RepID=UPI0013CF4FE6|nr:MalY/PatB family protein [Listeria sp. PSOL-1]